MADVLSPLIALSDGVRAWFAATYPSLGVSVPPVGFKQRVQKLNEGTGRANRVLFIPGTIPGGDIPDVVDLGSLLRGANRSGTATTNPRQLWEWDVPFTMSLWAADTTDVNDEQKQLVAVGNLLELAMRAIHNSRVPVDPNDLTKGYHPVGFANVVTPGKVRMVTRNREMAFGRELLVSFALKSPLYDKTYDVATPQPGINRDLVVP